MLIRVNFALRPSTNHFGNSGELPLYCSFAWRSGSILMQSQIEGKSVFSSNTVREKIIEFSFHLKWKPAGQCLTPSLSFNSFMRSDLLKLFSWSCSILRILGGLHISVGRLGKTDGPFRAPVEWILGIGLAFQFSRFLNPLIITSSVKCSLNRTEQLHGFQSRRLTNFSHLNCFSENKMLIISQHLRLFFGNYYRLNNRKQHIY